MATKNNLKKAACWPGLILFIFAIGGTSVSFGDQPAGSIHGGSVEVIGRDTADIASDMLSGASAARPEKVGYFAPAFFPRAAASIPGAKVTASWYGSDHQNKRTANGQRFQMHKNTLAHKSLPLGTKVRLTNPDNGKFAEGVVNDRGPYIKGRDVDVSFAMAKQLGFVKKGVMKLEMEMM